MTQTITLHALMQRINRQLTKEGKVLRKCNTRNANYSSLGDFYEVDTVNNSITAQHVPIVDWAKEMNCLKGYEVVEGFDCIEA